MEYIEFIFIYVNIHIKEIIYIYIYVCMYVCMYKGLRKSICPPQKKKKKVYVWFLLT